MTTRWPRLVVATLCCLVVLGGCGPSWKVVGVRPGMTREEASAIFYECDRSLPPPAQTSNPGVAYGQAQNRDWSFRMCLEAHGIQTADQ